MADGSADLVQQVASLERPRELCIENSRIDSLDLQQLVLPPRLVTLELENLGLLVLPPLPNVTLKRPVWREMAVYPASEIVRRTELLPSSLVQLQFSVSSKA